MATIVIRMTAVAETVLPPEGASADLLRLVEELAERVALRLGQREVSEAPPSGAVETVLAPGIGGIVVHELVGHALEADRAPG